MGELAVGATFADHVIRGVAGRGGMGVVYRALHVPLKREVALKVIASEVSGNVEFRTRFRREMEAAASIQHPNVITVLHAGEEDGLLYVTMRYVQGEDLARLVAMETRLDPVRAAVIVGQVAAALDAAHRKGLVHRDVKPANVLVESAGDGMEHALLTDFGLIKNLHSDSHVTKTGMLVGTFDYTAPEQLDGRPVDARTDVYALGCVLFQTLTGRVPYPRDSLPAKLFAHMEAPIPSVTALVEDVPPELDEVIRVALAKDPAERYQSAGDLARAALAAVDKPSLARGVSQLVAGEAAPGWRWSEATPVPVVGIPLQAALAAETGPLVGRDAPLARLEERFALAEGGARQNAVVVGPPGIGKTRLAAELARTAHARGATVLYGRSDPESLVPFQPFVTAVQHYIAHRDNLPLAGELQPELSELARLVPALRRHLPSRPEPIAEDSDTRRFRLFEAVTRLLAAEGSERPTLLILDDLQWADASTRRLLSHLLRDTEPTRLLVLTLSRDAAPGAIALDGLDIEHTRALAADLRPSDHFVHHLHDWTDGNPFFIKELLRSLAETGADPELALEKIAVPDGVKLLLGGRLARLSETANRILTVAAVVGRDFRLEVLEELLDEPVERIIAALEEASAFGIVDEVADDADRFVFAQALVRELLYESQSASRRVRLHHRIAEALETLGLGATPAQLAYHYFESRHLDADDKAVGYAIQAAEEAASSLAYEEAITFYRRALERTGPRVDLLLALGTNEAGAGDPAALDTFMRAAEIAESPSDLAEAALGRSESLYQAGAIDREAIALLERAIDAQVEPDALLYARLANVLHFAGEVERVHELSARALELARASGDPATLLAAVDARHEALLHAHVAERLALMQELCSLSHRTGELELQAIAYNWRSYDQLETGDVAAAREGTRVLTALGEEIGHLRYRYMALRWDVIWALAEDRTPEVEPLIERVVDLGRRAQVPDVDVLTMGFRLALAYQQHALGPFAGLLAEQIEANPQLRVNKPVLALALLQAGDGAEARVVFESVSLEEIPRDMLWLSSLCLLAEVAGALGDEVRGAELYEVLLGERERNVMVAMAGCIGSAERYLGLVAPDPETATAHLEAALARNEAGGIASMARLVREDLGAYPVTQIVPQPD